MGFIAGILAQMAQILLPWLMAGFMKWLQNRQEKVADESAIDAKLAAYKAAYLKAMDGKPMSPEQKKEMENAIRAFLKS